MQKIESATPQKQFTILKPPTVIGWYELSGMRFQATRNKPNFLQQKMLKFFFNLIWINE